MIDTDIYSIKLRGRSVIPEEKRALIARLTGSEQEKDLSTPTNCRGFGRIRHFQIYRHTDWSSDPLPNVPASRALNSEPDDKLRAQVFQIAACNWRCWYCYVDYNRLSADRRFAEYLTAGELIDMYLAESSPAEVIDLSGGQPDLVPEWTLWIMEALHERGLAGKIFLWSDDNLSTRFFWDVLEPRQRQYIAHFPKYCRVGCFKGYDTRSFSFNTLAAPEIFERQFEIYRDLLHEGFDMYAYVTFTALPHNNVVDAMKRFVDKLQGIHNNLPLRMVPLKIEKFTPTTGRIKAEHDTAIAFQHEVHHAWVEQLKERFSEQERSTLICDVPMTI